jgi:hypothetical protein
MGEEDFQYVRIRGLTHTCNPAASGWLCFCKTRCGNENFFKWYMTEVLVNFVEDVRQLLPDDMKDVCMCIVADGEEYQVKPIENDDVDAILFQHNAQDPQHGGRYRWPTQPAIHNVRSGRPAAAAAAQRGARARARKCFDVQYNALRSKSAFEVTPSVTTFNPSY